MLRLTGLLLCFALVPAAGCDNKNDLTPEQKQAQLEGKLKDAHTRLRNNRAKDAAELFNWVLKEDPNNAGALRGLSVVRNDEKKFDEAAKLATAATAAAPGDAAAHAALGKALANLGKAAEAAASHGEAFKLAPENGAYGYAQGLALLDSKQFAEAETVLAQTGEVDGQIKYVWARYGDSLREQGKDDKALKAYMKSLTLYKSDRSSHAGAAMIYEKRKETEKAVNHWSTYVRMDCCSPYSKGTAKPTLERLRKLEQTEIQADREQEKVADKAG